MYWLWDFIGSPECSAVSHPSGSHREKCLWEIMSGIEIRQSENEE